VDIVLEGGGAKGAAFVGALVALEAAKIKPARMAGSSAGSITAALWAAGYSAKELRAISYERGLMEGDFGQEEVPVFLTFMDVAPFDGKAALGSYLRQKLKENDLKLLPNFIEDRLEDQLVLGLHRLRGFRRLSCLSNHSGLYVGETFRVWLENKFRVKCLPEGFTFQTLFNKVGIDLSLVAFDVTGKNRLVLNQRTAPTLPVAWAVRMSMSFPFVWHPVEWLPEWGAYEGKKDVWGHKVIDGGTVSNFPIDLFVDEEIHKRYMTGSGPFAPESVIGLLLDETLAVPNAPQKKINKDKPHAHGSSLPLLGFISELIDALTGWHDDQYIKVYAKQICRLPAQGYGTLEFEMPQDRMRPLIDAACDATEKFLSQ